METREPKRKGDIPLYSLISFGAFACCLLVLCLLVTHAQTLTELGLTEHIFYLVFVLMGLTASGFLFGVLPSSARYEGKFWSGRLNLGGAIVGGLLVVVGAYVFVPTTFTFPLTVYVHGSAGPQDIVLRDSGYVVLKLGPDIRKGAIGDEGQAYFPAIPANFRAQKILVWVESDNFISLNPGVGRRLYGTSLELTVQKKINRYELKGMISDATGKPLAGVRVVLSTMFRVLRIKTEALRCKCMLRISEWSI